MDAKTLTHRLDVKDNHINIGEAMKYIHKGGRSLAVERLVLTILLFILMLQPVFGQVATEVQESEGDTIALPLRIDKEVEEKKGLIAEFLKFFKFRDNRDRKERERIQDFLEKLIQNDSLRVETDALENILKEINRKVAKGEIDIDSLQSNVKEGMEDVRENTDSIMASRRKLANLKTRLTALIKDSNSRMSAEEKKVIEELRAGLKLLKGAEESCDSEYLVIEEEPLTAEGKTGTMTFKRCLDPEIQVIGWHSASDKEAYKTYKYPYFSAINLYGYKVTRNGDNSKKIDLLTFQKAGGVIDYAHANATDVHLTVYSNSPADTHGLIESAAGQERLIENLKRLIVDYKMSGINIAFDKVPSHHTEDFVSFIQLLHYELRQINKDLQLNITIPAIWNEATLKESLVYDFEALSPYVNYFFVTTDAMTNRYNTTAQAASPLMSKGIERPYSIASTVDYYTNGKIAADKLIVSLSYKGIEWEVRDFSGARDRNTRGVFVAYKDIPALYQDNKTFIHEVIEGYDEDQATTFVNITQIARVDEEATNKQIWFEDMRSLYEKYKWIKENELGGVAIKGLGADDPSRSGLWDAMGAALVKVDTIDKVEHIDLVKEDLKKKNVFLSDWKWADDASLEYFYNLEKDSIRGCTDGHIKKRVETDTLPALTNIWKVWQPYISPSERAAISPSGETITRPLILENFEQCRCLMARWNHYSKWFIFIAIICTLLILVVKAIVYKYDRFLIGKKKRPFLRIAQGALFLIGLPALLAGIWLAPWNPFVGTNSDGTSRVDVVILGSVVIGLILGWIIRKWMISGRWRQSLLN